MLASWHRCTRGKYNVCAEIGRVTEGKPANNVRKLRLKKGITISTLASAAGLHTNQVQRLEIGRSPVKVRTAMLIAEAFGADLGSVFPAVRKFAKKKKPADLNNALLDADDPEQRELHNGGIDTDWRSLTLKFELRTGVSREFPISGAEWSRLWGVVQKVEADSPFFVFEAGRVEVMVNLLHVVFFESLIGREVPAETDERTDVTDNLQIYLSHRPEPLTISVDPDEGDRDDIDDDGDLRTILFLAESLVDENQFFIFPDADGERTFVRAADIALMTIPEWAIWPEMEYDAADPPSLSLA